MRLGYARLKELVITLVPTWSWDFVPFPSFINVDGITSVLVGVLFLFTGPADLFLIGYAFIIGVLETIVGPGDMPE